MLSDFLQSQEFSKGAVDPTLFTRKAGRDILLKYDIQSSDPVDTPIVDKSKLDEDLQENQSILHITVAKPTKNHLHAVKRIFRYLKGTSDMGLWYSKDSCITLTAYADADHVECQDTRRNTFEMENGVVELYFFRTEYQLADIFNKALPRERFNFLIEKLGMKNVSPKTLKNLAEEKEE
ncbi:hypothetical protein Tco_1553772 [Tanacetum coccineum]